MSFKYKLQRFIKTPAEVLLNKVKDKHDLAGGRFVLYGAGEIGRDFLNESKGQITIDLIIDRNAEKFPYEVMGIEVKGKDALADVQCDAVIVASEKFIDGIRGDIKSVNPNLKILALD